MKTKLHLKKFLPRFSKKKSALLVSILAIITVGFNMYFILGAQGATYTWDGGGATNNWSDCDNWSTNVCPTASDTAQFNGTSTKDAAVDAGFGGTVTTVSIASGYTGTISLERSLTISQSFSQAAGTFNGSSHTFSTRYFTLSAGVFTATSSTTTITGPFTVSGSPTFNANGGTVSFNSIGLSGSPVTYSCNNITFNLVTFDGNSSANGTTTISSDCTLPLGNNPTVDYTDYAFGSSTFNMNGTLTGTGTLTMTGSTFGAKIIFGSTAALSGFSGFSVSDSNTPFTTNVTTLDLGSYTTVNFDSTFTLASGTFIAPSGTMNVSSSLVFSGGTFSHNNGTIDFDGSSTITCTVANTFPEIKLTGSLNFGTGCTGTLIPSHPTSSGSITISGGDLSVGTNTSLTLGGFTISSGTFTAPSTLLDLNGGFTISSGTFTAPSGDMNISGNITSSGGTFNHNNGTVNFDGSTNNRTLSCGNIDFNLVTINVSGLSGSSSFTINNNCDLPLGNNPTATFIGPAFNQFVVHLNGTLSGGGTLNIILDNGNPSRTLNIQADAEIIGFSGMNVSSNSIPVTITLTNANLDLSLLTTADLNGSLTLSGTSVFTAPSGELKLSNALTIGSGTTYNHNGGTLTADGSTTLICTSATTFPAIKITAGLNFGTGCTGTLIPNNPTASSTLNINGGDLSVGTNTSLTLGGFTMTSGTFIAPSALLDINGFFSQTSGTLTAPSGTMSITGNLTYSGGTFNHNNGTIILDGSGTQTVTGSIELFSLTAIGNRTITFNAGGTKTVNGTLTLRGSTVNNRLTLQSSSNGTLWNLIANGPANIMHVSSRDANSCDGRPIIAVASVDAGNNRCWTFISSGISNTYILPGTHINEGVIIH